jgi:hypothetical protein
VPEQPRDPDLVRRSARVRSVLLSTVTLVVAYVPVHWWTRRIWPDQGDLSDIGTGFWRFAVSATVAFLAALAVLALTMPGRRR